MFKRFHKWLESETAPYVLGAVLAVMVTLVVAFVVYTWLAPIVLFCVIRSLL